MTQNAPRPAQPADVPALHRMIRGLAEYEQLLHRFVMTEAGLGAMLFGRDPVARALVVGEPVCGMAIYYYTVSTFSGSRGLFLEDLFVQPECRGQGLGLALLRQLAHIAVQEDCFNIEWRVLNWNQPSIDFYQSLGARQVTDWQIRELDGDALRALAKGTRHG